MKSFKRIHISVGSRIIKTSASAAIAMFAAESLGLDFSALAVTAAVMTLQPTLHETLDMAKRRMLGAFIGSLLAIPCVYFLNINVSIEIFFGVLSILALSNAFSLTTSSVLGVFAFVSIIAYNDATYVTMIDRLVNTIIGVGTSIIINALFPVQSIVEKSEIIMKSALRHELELLSVNLSRLLEPEKRRQNDLRGLTDTIIKELGEAYSVGDLLKSEQRFAGIPYGHKVFDEKYHALWIIQNSVLQMQIDIDLFLDNGHTFSEMASGQLLGFAGFLGELLDADTIIPKGTKNKIDELISAFEEVLAADIEAGGFSAIGEEARFYTVFLLNLKRFSENITEFETK